MATRTDFRRTVKDHAKLEGEVRISLGTTGFAGDGNRLFINFNEVGILFSHDDASAFLAAAAEAARRLGYADDPPPAGYLN